MFLPHVGHCAAMPAQASSHCMAWLQNGQVKLKLTGIYRLVGLRKVKITDR